MVLSLSSVIGLFTGLIFSVALRLGFLGFLAGYFIGKFASAILFGKLTQTASRYASQSTQHARNTTEESHHLFFSTTFEVLGHIGKAKGVVTQSDIKLASAVMDRMSLFGEARQAAQDAFAHGKNQGYPLRSRLRQLYRQYRHAPDLLFFFMEIQIQAACNDGRIHGAEEDILSIIAEELHISQAVFRRYIDMMEGNQRFDRDTSYHYRQGGQQYSQHQQRSQNHAGVARSTLQDAFKVLGLSESDDTAAIKQAYRKLMKEHHPDKLVAKGLPPEMLELAKRRTQEIQAAYDVIKRNKGFK